MKKLVVVLGESICADNFVKLASEKSNLEVKQFKLKNLPTVIEDEPIIPQEAKRADVVLDYTNHPEIPHLLKEAKKIFTKSQISLPNVISLTCLCSVDIVDIFGLPRFKLEIEAGSIKKAAVITTAPCGATDEVAKRLIGITIEEAPQKAGLFAQFNCTGKKDTLHCAGRVHLNAVKEAIRQEILAPKIQRKPK
ncbi:MAG: DUF166 family protein [bacterium]